MVRYSPQIAAQAQMHKQPTASSRRVDETYLKVRGQWVCLYQAIHRDGQTLDFMLSERRNLAAARRFFKKAIAANRVPERIVIDKSRANLAGPQAVNTILKFAGIGRIIEIRQLKYLNNILEQDHRFIKRLTKPMMGFKAFHSAAATLADIVRRIFWVFAGGICPRSIAASLNHEHIPGPAGTAWGSSTIFGNWHRGTGILNNELISAGWSGTGSVSSRVHK